MITLEIRHKKDNKKFSLEEGYFMPLDKLTELVRDFQVDNHDGFVSNDKVYIEFWLKTH